MMRPWFLLLLAAALPALAAPATYTLEYKDVPGTRHVYIEESKMTGSMAPATPLPPGATPIMYTYQGSGYEVTEERIVGRTSDAAAVKQTVTEGWSLTKTSSILGTNTRRSYSKPATITFDRGITGAMANTQSGVSTVGAAGADPVADGLTLEYGPSMQSLRLPEGPVAIGDSWETTDVVSLFPDTSADNCAVSKLTDVRVEGGRTCLLVVTKFTIGASVIKQPGPLGESVLTVGPITGTIQALWDPALGELVRQTTDVTIAKQLDSPITVREQAVTISAKGSMNVKSTLRREERPLTPIPAEGLLLATCPESGLLATDKCPKVLMKRFKAHVPSLPCGLGHPPGPRTAPTPDPLPPPPPIELPKPPVDVPIPPLPPVDVPVPPVDLPPVDLPPVDLPVLDLPVI